MIQCTPPVIVGCRGCLADVRAATMSDPGPLTPEEEALVAELERELFGRFTGRARRRLRSIAIARHWATIRTRIRFPHRGAEED